MSATTKKILVIRFSSIGDIVLTSPVVRCLKKQLNAEVHFLTKASYASIIEPNPFIDRVFKIKKQVSEVIEELKKEQYDFIIDLHKNWRSLQVKFAVEGKTSSFNKINIEKWLLTNLKINRLPKIHIVDRYLQTIDFLGVKNDGKGLDYFIPDSDVVAVDSFLKENIPYISFAIGAAHGTKRLPKEKILDICNQLKMPVVLLGGAGDAETGEWIAQRSGDQVVNKCNQWSIHQSASVIEQSRLVITPDTGMMHIAAAFKKPIISVWGNTIPDFGMYPYYPTGVNRNQSFEVKNLKCRPCSKIGHAECPKGHFKCMMNQDIEKIVEAAVSRFKN